MSLTAAERLERDYGPPEYRAYVHGLPCSIGSCEKRPIHQAHAGQHGEDSWKRTLALCWLHHHELHDWGVDTFQNRRKIDLVECAGRTLQEFEGRDW